MQIEILILKLLRGGSGDDPNSDMGESIEIEDITEGSSGEEVPIGIIDIKDLIINDGPQGLEGGLGVDIKDLVTILESISNLF